MSEPKPRIVVVAAVPPPHHGVTIYNSALLSSRMASSFEVIHIDSSDPRNLNNLGRFDLGNVLVGLSTLAQVLFALRLRPKAVYLPNSQNNLGFFRDGLFILAVKIFSRAKVFMHYHGSDTFTAFRLNTNWFMRWFIPFVLRHVDVGIVVGKKLRGVLKGLVKEVVVVSNGSSFDPQIQGRKHPTDLPIVVAYLGSLLRAKGVVDLLLAAQLVLMKHTNVKFKFAGEWWAQEPDTREEALRLIAVHRLQRHVEFVGKVLAEEKERFLFTADVFVFPSWTDSFGIANLEAMAAGCPVVATKSVGAIDEVVLDGVTGILVEKQKPDQLAKAILHLVENPDLRRRMGEAGRKRFEEHFTMEKNVERMVSVMKTALEMR